MKTTQEVKGKIVEAFKFHPKEDKLLVTTRGVIFLEKAKNSAVNYANQNGEKVNTVLRSEVDKIEVVEEAAEKVEETTDVPDFGEMSVEEISEFAKVNGIELEFHDKEDMIAELQMKLNDLED